MSSASRQNKDNTILTYKFGDKIKVDYEQYEVETLNKLNDEDGYKMWSFNNESCLREWLNKNTM